ncbi:glycosyltransferase family 2 protein [Cellulomonas hominis]|uniref:Glycosyl transferase family 2 n=1 Tax=Cellulomonas hominis TaxID=156981 RepID=A0A511F9E9_9CELL|nr:glycosyltransferase family 2 protein [Cellulomonas hominis]MBB5474021.1 glycosyltransferase involved in cell wall biosynthesis [Cellulomonas hominis]MBU5424042.1 glycosyltransferase family 2 protein [Cellulomonas hominis]NKY08377.1 glycosyltransferase family 2 protein [Cellulomonas hominis]GEL45184.1 glycosyl transferase family 2 [Cellulomonas hominis]
MPSAARMLVIVPAWNEQATVAAVVAELLDAVPGADVLVVDDGSTDRTAEIAARAGAQVLELPINLGVGGAMRAGYTYAMRRGYDLAVQVDADGQHDPREIPRLLETLDSEGADIVIGARFAGVGSYEARGPRWWSMRLLATVLSRVCRTRLTDATSGFKLSGRRAITLFAGNYPAEYLGDTVESLVIAARSGLVVRQVGVAMRPRAGGRPSHSPVRAAVFLGRAAIALVIALSRPTTAAQPALDLEATA